MKEGFQMVIKSNADDTNSQLSSEGNGDNILPVDNHMLRQRLTNHRQSLLRIHSDISDRRSTRHVVPDELYPRDGTTFGGDAPPPRHGTQRSFRDWLLTLIPMCRWLHAYDWRNLLLTDILAGVTVSVMIIPQSMSYAKIAGLPVQYGLYSSFVPIYAYAMFGSSRQLAVGPVALVSLLLNTGLTRLLEKEGITPETHENYITIYTTLAMQTSFLVGLCYIVMGLLRIGFMTIFLSHAVVSGFTSGAAIIIALSQAKYILGYSIPSDKKLQLLLQNIFANIDQFNYKTFLLGTGCILTLVGLKHLATGVPRLKWTRAMGPLLVTLIGIILQVTVNLEAHGIPIVGHIPQGLPEFTAEIIFPLGFVEQLSLVVFNIVIIGFMESIAIAKQLANKHSYQVDSSLELVGLGMANLMSGLFSGFPVVGSFSRSAVNNDAGAMSGISGIVTATLVGFVLLLLTPVFESLPLAVLASIVISGVLSLVDLKEAMFLWRVHRMDFGVWTVAFLGTLFLGVEWGLGLSVIISLLIVIFESAYPHTSVLGRLPGTHQYHNVEQYPTAEQYNGIVMVRIDAPIYFANIQNVRETIERYYQRAQAELDSRGQKVRYIVIDMTPVSHMDTGALHTLSDMYMTYLNTLQIQLCLASPNPTVMNRLVVSGLADEIGRDHIFVSIQDAVEYCLVQLDELELQNPQPVVVVENGRDRAGLSTSESLPPRDVEKCVHAPPPLLGEEVPMGGGLHVFANAKGTYSKLSTTPQSIQES